MFLPSVTAAIYQTNIYLDHMKSLLVQLDDATAQALDRISPPRQRQRSEFIRAAIRQAIRKAEFDAMKKAYQRKPDAESEADDGPMRKSSLREAVRSLVGRSAKARRPASGIAVEPRGCIQLFE